MTDHRRDRFSDWLCLIGSAVAFTLLLKQLDSSYASGVLAFSSVKYGFSFYGAEAAVIYLAELLGSALLGVVGYRGLARRSR